MLLFSEGVTLTSLFANDCLDFCFICASYTIKLLVSIEKLISKPCTVVCSLLSSDIALSTIIIFPLPSFSGTATKDAWISTISPFLNVVGSIDV